MRKRSLSAASKRKISLSQKGKNNSMYGKRHTREALKKIALASRGKNNPMYGRTHTAETRKKISLAARRRRSLIKSK